LEFWGNHLPELQKYAIRILSQPYSSSLCKQFASDDCAFLLNIEIIEMYKSIQTQMLEPINLDKLGEVFHDEWDDEYYQSSFDDFSTFLMVIWYFGAKWIIKFAQIGLDNFRCVFSLDLHPQHVIITTLMMTVVMRLVQQRICFPESINEFIRPCVLVAGLDCSWEKYLMFLLCLIQFEYQGG